MKKVAWPYNPAGPRHPLPLPALQAGRSSRQRRYFGAAASNLAVADSQSMIFIQAST